MRSYENMLYLAVRLHKKGRGFGSGFIRILAMNNRLSSSTDWSVNKTARSRLNLALNQPTGKASINIRTSQDTKESYKGSSCRPANL